MLKAFSIGRAKRGSAAVEFAFIAPIMVLVFFGLIELSEGMNAKQRMEHLASTSADLVAQSPTIDTAGVNIVFAAANAIMYPYPTTELDIVITSLQDDPANSLSQAKVVWSKGTANATTHSVGTAFTVGASNGNVLPPGIVTAGGSVILAEVTYTFTPVTNYVIGHAITMKTKFYSRPRRSVQVVWTTS